MLSLHCCAGFSLVVMCSDSSCFGAWTLGTWASVFVAPRLSSTGSIVVVHRPSCSMACGFFLDQDSTACGIFLDQGSNPCLLHWQADSSPLSHQGSLVRFLKSKFLLETHNDTYKSNIWGFIFKCFRKTLGCRESWGRELGDRGWHRVDILEAGDR